MCISYYFHRFHLQKRIKIYIHNNHIIYCSFRLYNDYLHNFRKLNKLIDFSIYKKKKEIYSFIKLILLNQCAFTKPPSYLLSVK